MPSTSFEIDSPDFGIQEFVVVPEADRELFKVYCTPISRHGLELGPVLNPRILLLALSSYFYRNQ